MAARRARRGSARSQRRRIRKSVRRARPRNIGCAACRGPLEPVVADGMHVPTGRTPAGPDRGARPDARQPRPASPRRPRLPGARVLDQPGRLRRPPAHARQRAVRGAGGRCRQRRPTRCSIAPSRCWCWPRSSSATHGWTWSTTARCSAGATGSRPGWWPRRTCAATCRARAGHTRSRTAPTRSARWPARPGSTSWRVFLLDVIADRVLEPTPEFWVGGRARPAGARGDGGAAPQPGGDGALDPWLRRLAAAAQPVSDDR